MHPAIGRLEAVWRAPEEPARYRATRRKSIRKTLTVAAVLVAAISILSGVQFAVRQSDASNELVLADTLQAAFALAVVVTMRTRLRRHPEAISLVFLACLPVVPVATLHLQPDSMILVAASLALIPVGVALLIAWPERTHVVWASCFFAIVCTSVALLDHDSLTVPERWEIVAVNAIGLTIGLLGQRRREQGDRLAFDRALTLKALLHQSADQQASLTRLNAELDRAARREVRGRESIEAALAKINSGATPEAIGAIACTELIEFPTIDAAWLIAFTADGGRVVATRRRTATGIDEAIPDSGIRRFRDKAPHGPWVESLAIGARTTIWSPLRGSAGIIGVIGCGSDDPEAADRVAELLPAIATYGSMVGALVAPSFEAGQLATAARARIRAILDDGSSCPFFQPIVDLRTGRIAGFEALTRFGDGTRPNVIFDLASTAGLAVELEAATIAAALEASKELPAGAFISLNASPELLYAFDLRTLFEGVQRPIVLEITEHVAIDDYARLRLCIDALGPKVGLAVDDAGAGYASLRHILELAPRKVKIDIALVRGIDEDPARQALIAGLGHFAIKRGIDLVAEGIETAAELATLRSLGVGFGQGYLLGRPQDGRGPGPWPTTVDVSDDGDRIRAEPAPRRRPRAIRPTNGVAIS